jgi:5-methylthioadenosine/S-adenosylhomocysteine deaminase
MKNVDIIIKNGYVVTMDEKLTELDNGAVAIKDNLIVAIGKTEDILSRYKSVTTIDASNKIVMPGLINTHTHIPMAFFRGLADDLELHDWLNNYIWPAESHFVDSGFVYDATLHGAAELIKNGITLFNDMYYHGKSIAKAAAEIGIRALVGEGIIDFPIAGYNKPEEMIDYALAQNQNFKDNELIDFTISPHSIYTCSADTLKKAIRAARDHNLLMHIHLSETEKELKDSLSQFGCRPVEYLNKLGFFDTPVIIAHGVWIDASERKVLSKHDVGVSLNTESNLKLASGFAPLKEYLEEDITVSMGTDGVASNNNLSLLEEMDITAKVHKAINRDPTVLPASQAVQMCTSMAAKAIGKSKLIGSLESGKLADVICIDISDLDSTPMYNVYSHLVYTLSGKTVDTVIINGKIILKDRILQTISETELLERSNSYQDKIAKFVR